MTPIEIIAVIFAIAILVKALLVNFLKPKPLIKLTEKMFKNRFLIPAIFLVFLAVFGYFLLQEITMAQLMVASFFGIYLYAMALLMAPKEMTGLMKNMLKNKKSLWFAWALWIVFAVLVLWSVF